VNISEFFDIQANTVSIVGEAANASTSAGTGGVRIIGASTGTSNVIEATASFLTDTPAIEITSSSAALNGLALGSTTSATDYLILRASGNNAGIDISGQTSRASSFGVALASVTTETKNGNVSITSGNREIGLGRSGTIFTYRPTSGNTGGDLTISSMGRDTLSATIPTSITTAGDVSFIPSGQSFSSTQTFPAADSTTVVGSLTVGSSTNTAQLNATGPATSTGAITYTGGTVSLTSDANLSAGGVLTVVSDTLTTEGSITLTGASGVALKSDVIAIGSDVSVTGGTSPVTISPRTDSRQIDLGNEATG
jgi:hypothetical protein